MYTIKLNQNDNSVTLTQRTQSVKLTQNIRRITLKQVGLRGLTGDGDKNHLAILSGETDVTIHHNLNKYPAVTVIDSAGDEVRGDYRHIDQTATRLQFSAGFSGKAIFN